MITVIIPVAILIFIVLAKFIPAIGGKVWAAILVAGALALILGGVFNPAKWVSAFIQGGDRIAWVIMLTIVGSIYAEAQKRMGTMETVLNACRAKFGHSPKGLVCAILFVLTLSGSLLGESIASAVVIGALVVMNLREVGMTKEQVCATIVMGCAMGSIMPPISQASTMAAGLVGLEGAAADAVLNWTYLTIGITFVLVCLFTTTFFVKIKQLPEDLIPDKKAGQIIKENWTSLVPLCFLALVVIFRSGFHLDLLVLFKPIFDPISKIPIVKGLGYNITQILYLTIILSLFYKPVRSDFGGIVKEALGHVWPTVKIQLCAAFMIGAFYVGGQIDKTSAYLATLSPGTLIVGGLLAMCLIGMLTGSQTTVQSTIFIMLGPALIQTGISPVSAAIAGGHWAMAGQGMPPADTVTFATAGLIDGIDESGEKVNLLQSMLYSCFMCACMIIAGLIFVLVIK